MKFFLLAILMTIEVFFSDKIFCFILDRSTSSFMILKPFGYVPNFAEKPSPEFILRFLDDVQWNFKESPDKPIFVRTSEFNQFHSFPQEGMQTITSLSSFIRKEFFIRKNITPCYKNLSAIDFKRDDTISYYLYDSFSEAWINPLMFEEIEEVSNLSVSSFFVAQGERKYSLLRGNTPRLKKEKLSLIIEFKNFNKKSKWDFSNLPYSFEVKVNGKKNLFFQAQSIKVVEGQRQWQGLDNKNFSLIEGVWQIDQLPLRVGVNEIAIEIRDFLYRPLFIKGYYRVLKIPVE